MEGEERRKRIIEVLKTSDKPLSGTALARSLKVSRQIVVGDVALLRACGEEIISTNKGYVYANKNLGEKPSVTVRVTHKNEDIFDELCSIIDVGGRVKDVFIKHPVYGEVSIDLSLSNRMDASAYAEKYMDASVRHISDLTKGVHYHTIEADNEIAIIRIQKALNDKGYLVK